MDKDKSQALRECLGKFATGVTVVTCQGSAGPRGITANSFSSVSLEPPLILWNIDKQSVSLRAFLDAEYFAINVLSRDQQLLAEHFAKSERCTFDGIDYTRNGREVPLLARTLACLECRTDQIHEAGDHHIIIGSVEQFTSNNGEPLLFFAGSYRG